MRPMVDHLLDQLRYQHSTNPDERDAWGWNWWEILSGWRSGAPKWRWGVERRSAGEPRPPVLPWVLPIVGCGNVMPYYVPR